MTIPKYLLSTIRPVLCRRINGCTYVYNKYNEYLRGSFASASTVSENYTDNKETNVTEFEKLQSVAEVDYDSQSDHEAIAAEPQVSENTYCFIDVLNLPRLVTRTDLVNFFKDVQVKPEDVRERFTVMGVPQDWCVRLPNKTAHLRALKLSGRFLGTRQARIASSDAQSWYKAGYPLPGAAAFKSVMVSGVPEEATFQDLQHFFEDYCVGGNPFDFFYTELSPLSHHTDQKRSPLMTRLKHGHLVTVKKHAIVRFISEEEAQRAARNTHNKIMVNTPVEVKCL
mmetsp:Transcript_39808/g.55284  ORF Transcript_39808/g.55284 Transcript_39808/m.55284 type:complete len:283 (+) Transcript_39808:84-932(+)|eukprot:CAMPEP_0196587416 /NCGR_PEP_ID=MMETSP1081-20130531/57415_1 /TAXON_ID=36882 /ORGANISM="Pyramimonas amylifera, Strain CCMP720" /LENGTH=282 /DNA_ID=CAMNT_0041909599 /DNA_START=84 /DNA_END=932 /DNA_ORIENTATION=-